jgi:hypothetical protein
MTGSERGIERCALLVLASIAFAGCKSQQDAAAPAPTHASASAPAAGRPSSGRVRIDPAPPTGDVEPIVRDALARAAAEKRRLVVYVGAAWCEPCRRFHEAAARGQLDATLPDLTLLEFDLDRDGERLASAGYVSKYIPLLALPNADGTSSGKQVEGGIKGEGAVAYITTRLEQLLAQ